MTENNVVETPEADQPAQDAPPVQVTPTALPAEHEHHNNPSEYTEGPGFDEHNEELADYSAEETNRKEAPAQEDTTNE